MGGCGSRGVDAAGRAASAVDLVASVLLLGVALALGLVGAMGIWMEAGLLMDSSGPSAPGMCTFERVVVAAVPTFSLIIVGVRR
jgi:hypothetical protein